MAQDPLKRSAVIHQFTHMVAEHPLNAVAGVTQKRSEEEQKGDDGDACTARGVLRGYYEADDGVHEVAGKYWWDDRSGDDADKNIQGEAVGRYSWSDGKKTVSIYIELGVLDDVAEDEFRAEAGETYISVTIASAAGKRRTFMLMGLANEITGVEVAQTKGKRLIDEMAVPVDVPGVGEEFDDVEQMTARIGAERIEEAFVEETDFALCAEDNEELTEGCQVCVKDFGNSRIETDEAGFLAEGEGAKMDTSWCLTKEEHQRGLRCEACSPRVNKSCFSFWDSTKVDPDLVENGMNEFDASTQAVSEVSTHEQSAEDGNVQMCCMGFFGAES